MCALRPSSLVSLVLGILLLDEKEGIQGVIKLETIIFLFICSNFITPCIPSFSSKSKIPRTRLTSDLDEKEGIQGVIKLEQINKKIIVSG
jgi:hypothetical protein